MCLMTEQRIRAGERYGSALAELRTAAAELSILDRILENPTFKVDPDIASLKHPTFAPMMLMESFSNDVQAARAARAR